MTMIIDQVTRRPRCLLLERPLTARERRIIEDVTRREFVIGGTALAALVAEGCGRDASESTASDEAGATITDHAGRTVEFERRPERIVVLSSRYVLDELLLLGIAPVGYSLDGPEGLPPWTSEELSAQGVDITDIGNPYNFERLTGLEPDVVIAFEGEEFATTIEAIAPMVVVDYGVDVAGGRLRMLADLVGRADRADEIVETIKPSLEAIIDADAEIAFVFPYSDGSPGAAVYFGDNDASEETDQLELAGLQIKSDYAFELPDGANFAEVTEENFEFLDSDWLWAVSPYADGAEQVEDVRDSPLWQSLQVVERGDDRYLDPLVSQAILFWTPLATDYLVSAVNDLIASHL